ncbi:hypothetical protein DXG01_007879 [Tephrocybe rancida]|nr:hypothetical protein DXG01_007879 [Tephrocybe rancida]
MDVDQTPPADAKVIIITNLTRNVAESHLQTIFSFYGTITKIDLPVFGKSGQNRGKAALEFADPPSAHKAFSHMDGGQLDGAILKLELSTLPAPAPPLAHVPALAPAPPSIADAATTHPHGIPSAAAHTALAGPQGAPRTVLEAAHLAVRALAPHLLVVQEVPLAPGAARPATLVEGTLVPAGRPGLAATRCAPVVHVVFIVLEV